MLRIHLANNPFLSINAGILLGFAMILVFQCFVAVPVMSPTGRYDIFTELILKCRANEELEVLKEDCIKAAAGEEVGPGTEGTAARGAEGMNEAKRVQEGDEEGDEDAALLEKPSDPMVSFSGDMDDVEKEPIPEVAPSKSEEEET